MLLLLPNNCKNWISKNQIFNISPVLNFLSGRQPLTEIKGLKQISKFVISGFSLNQKYPNPFKKSFKFKFYIPKKLSVEHFIYNLLCKEIASIQII